MAIEVEDGFWELPAFYRIGWALRKLRDNKLYQTPSADRDFCTAIVDQARGKIPMPVEMMLSRTKKKQRVKQPMTVYFIEAIGTDLVKIGHAYDPVKRMANLRTGSAASLRILCTISGNDGLESELHRRFSAHRSHGEWFHLSEEIRLFIATVLEGASE